ncbi:hypothetical protein CRE_11263 [Caenorhabditis remanei]|uniref:Reverse transcriptase domain-containing protein n=1 Tax=Caenorhabditis remanei TaxID=31234 RepID=E3MQ88_CAERE|nr:hypothetical protein CRE_11263 [Caenorhabditis remanei]
MMSGEIPDRWKTSIVMPLNKISKPKTPTDFRPISITSNICRVFERCLLKKSHIHLSAIQFWNSSQHGFLPRKSTTTCLLESMNEWTEAIDKGSQVDLIYFDFAKAFDRVPHCQLLDKLQELKLNKNLVSWISAFLKNRIFKVKVGASFSSKRTAICGVPQGSVLSPVLFGIFVNTIPSALPQNVRCKQFADDLKLYAILPKDAVDSPLPAAIEAIIKWSKDHRLALNNEKTSCITLGTKPKIFDYSIDGSLVRREEIIRDLGFMICPKLDFSQHWKKYVNNAKCVLTQIFNQYSSDNPRLLILLYKTFVRPILEYGTVVTSPLKKSDIRSIESVQNSLTRRIRSRELGKYISIDDPDYKTASERNEMFGLSSLESRRTLIDHKFVSKMLVGKVDIDTSKFFKLDTNNKTRTQTKFIWPKCKTRLRRHFFTNRALTTINK